MERIYYSRSNIEKLVKWFEREYIIPEGLICAIIEVESSWDVYARRYERWMDKDKTDDMEWEANASYGLTQILGKTAYAFGFPKSHPLYLLYSPYVNLYYCAQLLRELYANSVTPARKYGIPQECIVLARYNGGYAGNPSDTGELRNISYVRKVIRHWWKYISDSNSYVKSLYQSCRSWLDSIDGGSQ